MKRYLCVLIGNSDPPSEEQRIEKCIFVFPNDEKLFQYTLDGKLVDEFTVEKKTSDSILWVAPSFAGQTTISIRQNSDVEYNMPGSGLISIFRGVGKMRKLNNDKFPDVPKLEQSNIIDSNEYFNEKEKENNTNYLLWFAILFVIIVIMYIKN